MWRTSSALVCPSLVTYQHLCCTVNNAENWTLFYSSWVKFTYSSGNSTGLFLILLWRPRIYSSIKGHCKTNKRFSSCQRSWHRLAICHSHNRSLLSLKNWDPDTGWLVSLLWDLCDNHHLELGVTIEIPGFFSIVNSDIWIQSIFLFSTTFYSGFI